jgi:hypothetical protein
MNPLLIALALLLVVLFAWWWLRQRRGSQKPAEEEADRLDTLAAWPPQATRVLTSQERTLHSTLVRALPDHVVLSQVPLSRFLKVPKRHSYAEWLRRLGYQSVDFVVCDMTSHVVAVIELQPTANDMNERARKRLKRILRTVKAAEIPLLVWSETNLPTADAARAAILPPPPTPATPADTARTPVAPPAVRGTSTVPTLSSAARPGSVRSPFEDTDRDSTQDEHIEAPPSTWFDDLDSGPTPLPQPPAKPKR